MKLASKYLFLSLLIVMGFATTATPAVRSITDNGACTPVVNIEVTPDVAVLSYGLEEYLPPTLVPSNINENGTWDPGSHKIRWGPFTDNNPITFSYDVTGADIEYSVDGVVSMDGVHEAVTGSDAITVNCLVLPDKVATPVFVPPTETKTPVDVIIICETVDAEIRYTMDGTIPDENSTLYEIPFNLTVQTHLRARAFKQDMINSEVSFAFYPEPSHDGLVRVITLSHTCQPNVRIQIKPVDSIKCYAVEDVLSENIMPVNISKDGKWDMINNRISWGPFFDITEQSLTYDLLGVTGEHFISGSASFDGKEQDTPGNTLAVIEGECARVALPNFDPPNGTFAPVEVTITSTTPAAEIRYTTDGSVPDLNSPVYSLPVQLTAETLIKAIAYKDGMFHSNIAEGFYPLDLRQGTVERTIINNSNNCTSDVSLKAIPNDTVKSYAVEETLPFGIEPLNISKNGLWDNSTRKIRWGPFEDPNPRTLTYILTGAKGTHNISGLGSFDGTNSDTEGDFQAVINCGDVITEQVALPVFNPTSGSLVPVDVTITSDTEGAIIRYTADGSIPDVDSTLYEGPLHFTSITHLRAKAFNVGMNPSDTASAMYPKQTSLFPVTFEKSINSNHTCSPIIRVTITPDASVRSYAFKELLPFGMTPSSITAGGVWDASTSVIRWGPFNDHQERILNYTVSGVSSSYTIDSVLSADGSTEFLSENTQVVIDCSGPVQEQVATPVFDPTSGTNVPVNVYISCATQGAVIHYTTDGSMPDAASTLYNGMLTYTNKTTLRAIAIKSDMLNSKIAAATYTETLLPPAETERLIEDNQSCSPSVNISIVPNDFVKSYAVEEILPYGFDASNINQGGMWDPVNQKVKWGPFTDNTTRTFTYSVTSSYYTNSGEIDGKVSFDGISEYITQGNTLAEIDCAYPTGITVIAGNSVLYVSWQPTANAAGYRVYYGISAENLTEPIDAASINNYVAIENLTNGTLYYITVIAYDANGNESPYIEIVSATPFAEGGTLGFISLDKEFYNLPAESKAEITLKDKDLNTDAGIVDTVDVEATSSADSTVISITLAETGTDTGIFTTTASGTGLGFTLDASDDSNDLIHYAEGSSITVTYADKIPAINRSATAIIDTTKPVTTLSPSRNFVQDEGNSYAASDYTYTLTATDTISGVDRIEYALDSADFEVYSEPFNFISETDHTVDFYAVDHAGNQEETKRQVVKVDDTPPIRPAGLTGIQVGFSINLTWSASTSTDVKGYNIYRNGEMINTDLLTTTEFSENLISGKTFIYNVTAIDRMDYESPFSNTFSITTQAVAPIIIQPVSGTAFVDGQITVQGNAEAGAFIEIFVNGESQGTTIADSDGYFSMSDVDVIEGENSLTAISTNSYGVTSPASQVTTVPHDLRPTQVSGIGAIPGDTVMTITWVKNPEDDIAGYNVYRDGQIVNNVPITEETQYRDSRLTNGRTYEYEVTAVDNNGTEGNKGEKVPIEPVAGPEW